MTTLREPSTDEHVRPRAPRTADATTLIALFVVLQFGLPATLVLDHLPMALRASTIVALGLGVLWFCTQMTTTLGAAKGSNPVRTAVFVYACVVLAVYGKSSFTYLDGDERASGDHAMVIVLSMICLALAICDGVRSRERIGFLLRVMVVGACWVSFVGIVQYLFLFDITGYLQLPGMQFGERYDLVLVREGLPRVSGTTQHPIEFGVFSAMMLPLALHVAFTETRGRRWRGAWWGCVALIATGLMFSASRSAILALACTGIVLSFGWTARRRLWTVAAGLVFLVFIKLISPGLLGALVSLFRNAGNDDSVRYRTHDYDTAREAISANPLLGRGIGTWYSPKRVVFDNQYLLTLVDSGIIGLAAVLGMVFAAMYCVRRVVVLSRVSPAPVGTTSRDRDLALSLGASLAAILPTYATFDFAAFSTVNSLMYLVVGVSGALLRVVATEVAGDPVDEHAVG
ncbi:O-antigen ligase family protein [Nocardioides baculatus]|uniref:O-antigen ligase family protein n=1 Tax=Nocardioides baculatus TaxID=2801337 RepID=A0ABS1LA12_9ACTN|nr:O-antigen ligase family protein [Nocardioides baculatus]MBL0748511.1 O-antigen ligase family protein [Nocardioides baculatus]